MKAADQLGDFRPCSKQEYQQNVCELQTDDLFVYKVGFNNIMVKAPKAQKKIHCWRLKTLEITQFANQIGSRQKAVAKIKFDGELIFSLLDLFNKKMKYQILEYVQSISNQLRSWCQAPTKNVFHITERTQQSLGYKQGFFRVTPVLFYLGREYYFESRRWNGKIQSDVPEIQIAQNVSGTSSVAWIFKYIYAQLQKQKMQTKLMEQKRRIKKIRQQQKKQRIRKQLLERQKQYNQLKQQDQYQISNY